jgi:ubiquinone/menaquinone biosynthesis C-methylase UbiE
LTEWNQILREKWYSQEEPDELVVRFLASLKKKNEKARVLDLGCGAGRNLTYAASQKFEAHGVDMSETGLNLTKERLRKRKLEAHILKGDMNLLPYVDSCFDAVVCLFTIYHQNLKGIRTTVSEVHRILKKGGLLLTNFQSKRSHMYGKGMEVEKDTFLRQDGPEKGVVHHFMDGEEVARLFKNFKKVDIELLEQKSADGYFQSRLIVVAKV